MLIYGAERQPHNKKFLSISIVFEELLIFGIFGDDNGT